MIGEETFTRGGPDGTDARVGPIERRRGPGRDQPGAAPCVCNWSR